MDIFQLMSLAQRANPKAEVQILSGGHDNILIVWRWGDRIMTRRYCKHRIESHRLGAHDGWKQAMNAAAELMSETATD